MLLQESQVQHLHTSMVETSVVHLAFCPYSLTRSLGSRQRSLAAAYLVCTAGFRLCCVQQQSATYDHQVVREESRPPLNVVTFSGAFIHTVPGTAVPGIIGR